MPDLFRQQINQALANKPLPECIRLFGAWRDKLDVEIKVFREKFKVAEGAVPLKATREEHRYFVDLKDKRKKLQHEVKTIRRKLRREHDQKLHQEHQIMTKQELKEWRVITHKHYNARRNFDSMVATLHHLKTYSKYEGLLTRLTEEFPPLLAAFDSTGKTLQEVEVIITKQFYKEKEILQQHIQLSSTTERGTPGTGDVTV